MLRWIEGLLLNRGFFLQMIRRVSNLSVLLASLLSGCRKEDTAQSTQPAIATAADAQLSRERNQKEACIGTLAALALERFTFNESRGEHWVLTVHDDSDVRKFT